MDLLLQRFSDNRDSTLGLLFRRTATGLLFMCYVLEDEYREKKVSKETRIPAGKYTVDFNKADTPMTLRYRSKYPFFKYHLEIKNVPNFQGIYMHIGNVDADTDGCLLLGDTADNNIQSSGNISNSTAAFTRVYKEIQSVIEGGKKVTIEIRDEKTLS